MAGPHVVSNSPNPAPRPAHSPDAGSDALPRNRRFHPWPDLRRHRLLLAFALTAAWCCLRALSPTAQAAEPTIARFWDEEILAAIRIDLPHPPVHARNLFHLSVAMYDAWAAYDPVAVGYLYHGKHSVPDVAAARRTAISFAAYRILKERYALSRGSAVTLPRLDAQMVALGFDPSDLSEDPTTPVGLGNRVAATVSTWAFNDGALQAGGYKDLPPAQGGYLSVNEPLITTLSGILITDVNRWQPLVITNGVSQNNIPVEAVQKFLGAQWLAVRPFALERTSPTSLWIDPGPPPQLGTATDAAFRADVVEVLRRSSELTPDDGVVVDLSPGAWGNNSLGANDGTGHSMNPATGAAYPPNPVRRGDFARVLAEFWADGPSSETPPGHWNTIANKVSDHPDFVKRLGGAGPVLDDLEWDVKLYFALNAALHDAACAAWSIKRYYDGWRPISALRYQGRSGQSSDPAQPQYHTNGLPLIPGLIEMVTTNSARPRGPHEGLIPGTVAIYAWPGQPVDPTNRYSGVRWISPLDWLPYQKRTFVTPAFPGFISGHSTFSRAAAETLTAITGSPFFPGGLGTFDAPAGLFLTFERGPHEAVQLQWGTYFDAADQAGLSRIWGGIHPPSDDLNGRRVGATVGRMAWALARRYFDGSILQEPLALQLRMVGPDLCEISFPTRRGLTYRLQGAHRADVNFTDEAPGPFQAVDSGLLRVDQLTAPMRFFRVVRSAE